MNETQSSREPLVSVVIPTFNRADLLREALDSVFAQTHQNLQVIVVDDGSTDHTHAMLETLSDRVETIFQSHAGVSAARNAGITAARGRYVAFLDSDDLWIPEKVAQQVAFLERQPEVSITYTDANEFKREGLDARTFSEKFPGICTPPTLFRSMIERFAIPLTSTTMVRRDFLEDGPRFPPDIQIGEDLGFFLDAIAQGAVFAYLPERLTKRRLHENNISGNHQRRFEQRQKLYGGMLARRPSPFNREQRDALRMGLRDAEYRVGECRWRDLELAEARAHFFRAANVSPRGMRAAAYGLLSFLPPSVISSLRGLKKAS
jgi:glycosyltransferase involved in cell wall biosynthesis